MVFIEFIKVPIQIVSLGISLGTFVGETLRMEFWTSDGFLLGMPLGKPEGVLDGS